MENDSELLNNYSPPSGEIPNGGLPPIDIKIKKIRDKIESIAHFVNNISNKISMIILFLLMFLTAIDVVARNFFNKAIIGTFEITGLGVALIVFFSLGSTQLKGEHISIDVFKSKFPAKVRGYLGLFMNVLLFILLLLTTWQLVVYTINAMINNQITTDLSLQIYMFTLLGSIGFLFFTITILVSILNSLLEVVEK